MGNNNRHRLHAFRLSSALFMAFHLVSTPVLADFFNVYVGQTFYLPVPKGPSQATIYSWSYSSTNSKVNIINRGLYSASEAMVKEYFTGSQTLSCYYAYQTYINGYSRAGTGYDHSTVSCKSNDISISASQSTMYVGDRIKMSYKFSHTILDVQPEIEWESSSRYVAGVDMFGNVTALSEGRTTISAKSNLGGNIANFDIEVKNNDPTDVRIPYSLYAYVGETEYAEVTLTPYNAQTVLSWHISPTSVASVSGGNVTGRAEGRATLYCTTSNGLRSNDCEVTVSYRPTTGIKISKSSISVPIGQNSTLSWNTVPSNARPTTVTWKSLDPSVATVSQSGVVTGVKKGRTTIRITSANGYEASCSVTVPPDPDKVSIPDKVSVYPGRTRKLKLTCSPLDSYMNASWSSSDRNVATVSSDGTVTAVHPGKAVITVRSQNGKTAKCELIVPEPSYMLYVWTKTGDSYAFYLPLSDHPRITENNGVLWIDCKRASISFPADELRKFTIEDSFQNELPLSISLPSELTVNYKERTSIDYKLYPDDYDIETDITWKSTDTSIASVSTDGQVTGCHPGECDIIATASNGRSSSCHVTVLEHDAYLVLWQWNGPQVRYHLSTMPRIRHSDGEFIIKSDEIEVSYPEADVRKFTLATDSEDDPTAVDNAIANDEDFSFTMSTAKPGTRVSICTINGQLVETLTVGYDGQLHYSFDSLPSGTYIIRTETTNIKIYKK